jgi:hypothetical protein
VLCFSFEVFFSQCHTEGFILEHAGDDPQHQLSCCRAGPAGFPQSLFAVVRACGILG